MIETLVTGCQNRSVSDQVSQQLLTSVMCMYIQYVRMQVYVLEWGLLGWLKHVRFTVLGCQPENICVFSHVFRLVHHSRNVSMFSMFSGWYPRTVCCVQPGYMAAANVMLPVQERDHKNQNLLTLLGKCKECSELLSHLLTFVIILYLCAHLCTLCVYHARSVMCISCFLRLECPHARDSPLASSLYSFLFVSPLPSLPCIGSW